MATARTLTLMVLAGGAFAAWCWLDRPSPEADGTISLEEFEGLDVAKQKEIWDLEHVTFEIETHVGKPISQALVARSAEGLAAFFGPEFTGSYPQTPAGATVEQAGVLETRRTSADSDDCDRAAFCEHLVASLASFETVDSARFKVLKIKRNREGDGSPVWHLDLLLSAKGKGDGAGPVMWESRGRALCRFADDEEIVAGEILERWEIETEALRTARQPLMEEVTRQVGLDKVPIPGRLRHYG